MINIQPTLRTAPDLFQNISLAVLFRRNGNSNTGFTQSDIYIYIEREREREREREVKCSRYRPGVAHRVGRGIALLFHDRGTRRG